MIAFALARAQFDPKAVTEPMKWAIRTLYYWIPPVLMLAQAIPMLFYNLDKVHPAIVRELTNRSAAQIDPVSLARRADVP
jgi:Na+/melibiose symporter-like transporter